MSRRRSTRRASREDLADVDLAIGPNTRRLQTVRAGIHGVGRALDRRDCRDADVLMRLTLAELDRLPKVDADTIFWLDHERGRFDRACRVQRRRR